MLLLLKKNRKIDSYSSIEYLSYHEFVSPLLEICYFFHKPLVGVGDSWSVHRKDDIMKEFSSRKKVFTTD